MCEDAHVACLGPGAAGGRTAGRVLAQGSRSGTGLHGRFRYKEAAGGLRGYRHGAVDPGLGPRRVIHSSRAARVGSLSGTVHSVASLPSGTFSQLPWLAESRMPSSSSRAARPGRCRCQPCRRPRRTEHPARHDRPRLPGPAGRDEGRRRHGKPSGVSQAAARTYRCGSRPCRRPQWIRCRNRSRRYRAPHRYGWSHTSRQPGRLGRQPRSTCRLPR
jgi:hypothetical protein